MKRRCIAVRSLEAINSLRCTGDVWGSCRPRLSSSWTRLWASAPSPRMRCQGWTPQTCTRVEKSTFVPARTPAFVDPKVVEDGRGTVMQRAALLILSLHDFWCEDLLLLLARRKQARPSFPCFCIQSCSLGFKSGRSSPKAPGRSRFRDLDKTRTRIGISDAKLRLRSSRSGSLASLVWLWSRRLCLKALRPDTCAASAGGRLARSHRGSCTLDFGGSLQH